MGIGSYHNTMNYLLYRHYIAFKSSINIFYYPKLKHNENIKNPPMIETGVSYEETQYGLFLMIFNQTKFKLNFLKKC